MIGQGMLYELIYHDIELLICLEMDCFSDRPSLVIREQRQTDGCHCVSAVLHILIMAGTKRNKHMHCPAGPSHCK